MPLDIIEIRVQRDGTAYQYTVVVNGVPRYASAWDYSYELPNLLDIIEEYRTHYDPKE